MNLNFKDARPQGGHIAMIVSRFNESITSRLLEGAIRRANAVAPEVRLSTVWVPGAVELPTAALLVIQSQKPDAVVCFGTVIRGETDHYHWVCSQVSQGVQAVALQEKTPVIFGVLTTDTMEQAESRVLLEASWNPAHGPGQNKGAEAMDAALEMVCLANSLKSYSR